MKFRKLLVLSSTVACALSLGACDSKTADSSSTKQESSSVAQSSSVVESSSSVAESSGKSVNVGMGYSASVSGNQLSVTGAMVAFDATTGKVAGARIDVIQIDYTADENETGLVLNYGDKAAIKVREDGYVNTKLELGKNYGMLSSYGSKLAEVDNQIEAYADWTVGKTAAEISSSLKDRKDEGAHYEGAIYAADDALWAQCTITANGFAAAVASAYENKSATTYTVSDGFQVGIAMNGGIAYNYGNPSHEISVDLAGTIVSNGKVEAAAIDAIVASYKIDENEKLVSTGDETKVYTIDTSAKYHTGSTEDSVKFLSKKVLGSAYAMKSTSAAKGKIEGGAEWFEQAAAIEAGVVGKTATEVKALTEISGATITLTSYVSALARSAEYAVLEHVGPQHE